MCTEKTHHHPYTLTWITGGMWVLVRRLACVFHALSLLLCLLDALAYEHSEIASSLKPTNHEGKFTQKSKNTVTSPSPLTWIVLVAGWLVFHVLFYVFWMRNRWKRLRASQKIKTIEQRGQ